MSTENTDAIDPGPVDCIVVGAGPGGLTAAMYLRRFRRRIVLLDGGRSRAHWIPETRNCPGFPTGISGVAFLQRLREQAQSNDAIPIPARAEHIRLQDGVFVLDDGAGRQWSGRTVILATGVIDTLPPVPDPEAALQSAVLRVCAICDGMEATDRRIAVYGPLSEALGHALFLRTFSCDVVVLPSQPEVMQESDRRRAEEAGVRVLGVPTALEPNERCCRIRFADGSTCEVDALYPALGARSENALALALGAATDDEGALLVDAHQRTSVAGLYAVGDVVSALNQIAIAVGHAAIAATAVHNALPANFR